MTDAAAVKRGQPRPQQTWISSRSARRARRKKIFFKIRFLLLCPIFVCFVVFVVSKRSDVIVKKGGNKPHGR